MSNWITVASFSEKGKIGHIIKDRIHIPFCDLCDSFHCIHVEYSKALEHRVAFINSMGPKCPECGNHNYEEAFYCSHCGARLEGKW